MAASGTRRQGAGDVTADTLRRRFARTRLPTDPLDVSLPAGSRRWPAALRRRLTVSLAPAGVLIPIMARAGGLSVLLTQRAADLKHHAGQIAFPGGQMEAGDRDLRDTALRETEEEVGIARRHVSVIGYLDAMPTITGFAVTPVVGLVHEAAELRIDRTEVEDAFEIPLGFLLDESHDRYFEREVFGLRLPMVEMHFEGRRIWGATAHMLVDFRKKLI